MHFKQDTKSSWKMETLCHDIHVSLQWCYKQACTNFLQTYEPPPKLGNDIHAKLFNKATAAVHMMELVLHSTFENLI
jgi:hypothetical protein